MIFLSRRSFALIALATSAVPSFADETKNVLSLGSDVTEIVYALGAGDRLVARDSTSMYPPEAIALPDVGYVRALSPEGVLSVDPTIILASEGAGPMETIDGLKAANIDFISLNTGFDPASVADKIKQIGTALDLPEKAETLADTTAEALAAQIEMANAVDDTRKRVMFVLSLRDGKALVSGTSTGADALIAMAGGVNALDSFEGYKMLSDEAASSAAPDVILMMNRGGSHGATAEELFSIPALAITPAAETMNLQKIDGAFIAGAGPRTPEVVAKLHDALYGS